MPTARELVDRIRKVRQAAWEKSDPTQAVVATQRLNPDDERVVRREVAAAGFTGNESEEMVRQVSAMLVGQVTSLDDSQPADGAD